MKLLLYILIVLITVLNNVSGQNANVIIQVNEKLVTTPLFCSVAFDSINGQRVNVWYLPGELQLDTVILNRINKDPEKPFWLHFSSSQKGNLTSYYVELTSRQLKKNYLILNVYDFNDKKYKHWYQWLTDKNFIVEIEFDGSGKYVKKH